MFHPLLPAVLALASMQAGATPPRPDDASAAVPETTYRPPQAYRPADKPPATPDRHWVEANRSVLRYNPMMLTMPERAAPAPATDTPPAGPAPAPAPAHNHAAHGHHDKGHH